MTRVELQVMQDSRLDGETVNATKERLLREGKLVPEKMNLPQEAVSDNSDNKEGFFPEDLKIPRLKIVQPTSRIDGAKEGSFYNVLTGEEREKLVDVIFLERQNARVLFVEDDFSGERECWSFNGTTPAREDVIAKTGQEPKAPCCITKSNGLQTIHCPFAMWNEKAENGTRTPKCKQTINFVGIDVERLPFFITFHGTAIPVIKKFVSTIYLKRKQAAAHGKDLRLRDFKVTIELKLKMGAKGKYFVPNIEKMEEIKNEEERKLLTKCFDSLSRRSLAEP